MNSTLPASGRSLLRLLQLLSGVATLTTVVAIADAQLAVVSTSPGRNAINVAANTPIAVTFDRAVDRSTFIPQNFRVFGKLCGALSPAGGFQFSNGDRTVTFTLNRNLSANEVTDVIMSKNLRAVDGTFLRSAGFSFQFQTRSSASHHTFRQIASISNRDTTGAQTRIYGGVACDLNADGYCDISTINEVSSDLRVFLNRADGSGLMRPMLQPYTPIPVESSPNDVADFDGDGFTDIVTSAYQTGEIAVCFGRGDGTFRTPVTRLATGSTPRGFGIIDVDGDGDQDITVANAGSNSISIIRSNGNGTFAPAVSLAVAGNPYGLAAADMNNDGIMDLVAGCRADETAKVLRGNGNGTFTLISTRPIGGQTWVVMCGDLNGDGNMDVSAANSFSNNGSILLGNGNGSLQAAQVRPTGGHTVSSDLADVDGDGDLDWVLSSFGAGLWYVYLNNGSGGFSPLREVVAPANPSCAIPADLDNDGDMDLVLTDEIADVLVVLANVCPADYDDGSGSGTPDNGVGIEDLLYYLGIYSSGAVTADLDDGSGSGITDGGVGIEDLLYFLQRYDAGC